MASNSLNAQGQEKMGVLSLDFLKSTLGRRPSRNLVCCNESICINLQERSYADMECDTAAVELDSGSCKKCGKTKLKNKSGIFKFLRKWLWWQNNLGADVTYKCNSETDSALRELAAPSDSESKDNVQFSECVNRSNVNVAGQLSDEGTNSSLTLDTTSKPTNNYLHSDVGLLDDELSNMDSNDCGNSQASDVVNNDVDQDKEAVDDSINAQPLATSVTGSLTCQLLKLSKFGWYWGPVSREEAEEKLENQPDGAFLVRDSSACNYLLSLSFRSSGKILHARIEHNQGLFSFYNQPEQGGFATIVELIDHSVSLSQSAVFCYSRPRSPGHPAFPVRLTKPVSRFTHVKSLQYLCRFVIRQYVTIDHIESLPLPVILKKYVQEGHY